MSTNKFEFDLIDIGESNPVLASGRTNPDRAQKLISSSMSRHLLSRNISSKSMHAFLVILLTDRQIEKLTRANTFTYSFVGGKNRHFLYKMPPR